MVLQNCHGNNTGDLSKELKTIHARFALRPEYVEDSEKVWDLVVVNEVLRIFD